MLIVLALIITFVVTTIYCVLKLIIKKDIVVTDLFIGALISMFLFPLINILWIIIMGGIPEVPFKIGNDILSWTIWLVYNWTIPILIILLIAEKSE